MTVATTIGVAVSFVGVGLVAWRVRPSNRTGALMVMVGLLWALAKAPLPVPSSVEALSGGAWAAVLAHLVAAFPTGHLETLAARAVVGLAYLITVVAGLLAIMAPAASDVGVLGAVVGGVAVIGLQVGRWRRSSGTQRRSLAPVFGAAVAAAALFVAVKPVAALGLTAPYLSVATQLALAAIPVAYLVSLVRRRIDRAGVAELVVRLQDAPEPTDLQRALADTLHDPTLQVGYWMPEQNRYVASDGQPLSTSPGEGRAVTRVDRNGGPLALLVHDPALLDNPELIDAACAAAALALENERLTAELRARLRQLAGSRRHILQAAERERRRLERDLHDGVQQRLLSIPMTLGMAESALRDRPDQVTALLGDAKRATLAVLAELRALSQGIHPPILTERGLDGAVRELAALAPVPLQLTVELAAPLPLEIETTAYYVVAEALANVTRHANAQKARVRIAHDGEQLCVEIEDDGCGGVDMDAGSGLRGLADRVADNGGALHMDSPPGHGTRIRAVLPCG